MPDDPRRRENDRQASDVYHRIDELEETITGLALHGHPEIGQIIDILEGPEVKQLGGPPTRTDGLVDKVDAIWKKLGNGGIKIKLPPGAWVAIWVAIITGVFNVVVALITAARV